MDKYDEWSLKYDKFRKIDKIWDFVLFIPIFLIVILRILQLTEVITVQQHLILILSLVFVQSILLIINLKWSKKRRKELMELFKDTDHV